MGRKSISDVLPEVPVEYTDSSVTIATYHFTPILNCYMMHVWPFWSIILWQWPLIVVHSQKYQIFHLLFYDLWGLLLIMSHPHCNNISRQKRCLKYYVVAQTDLTAIRVLRPLSVMSEMKSVWTLNSITGPIFLTSQTFSETKKLVTQ